MKKVSLVIGILLMFLAFVGALLCIILPSMTNNRVSFDEAMLGLIPAVIILFLGFVISIITTIL